ncbi:hypothetical protein COCC4DRAFT_64662 [Bipolaris maydis ATCC 48331]|uniref:Uncharacterized protein n=2 Tax=Cochliobolus heterostrophus TaxID=5016 RepID=M2ULM6_COCH5|nr:uncharacterized protein COCC4DRAFT_64662 [Bipolaris maydis ATCC 48331]EMD94521.1 hypothetical protein COCHEDRAFT_1028395 [Bipolaris maydis C5]ENI01135.1 hypothetical protein COCC4DRAFT_64662 [Bipolaris maydis ATCC 48331]KAJ6209934.1 hypothetical protein PSV09DRAFT_1028395 [Bipolaris maydis]
MKLAVWDGLQNIEQNVLTPTKVEPIRKLADASLMNVEATSSVTPKWVPPKANDEQVTKKAIHLQSNHAYPAFPVLAPHHNFPIKSPYYRGRPSYDLFLGTISLTT